MANAIELITKYSSKAWDKVYKREAISSVLDGDKDLLKFTGAKTVKIARFASSGLSDYHRPNSAADGVFGGDGHDTSMGASKGYGYQQGDASLIWEEFTIACDRGVQLRIELFDDEETDGLAVAAATTEVSRTQVIPEVDAYVFSKLAGLAGSVVTKDISIAGLSLGISAANAPIYELNAAFLALAEAEVPETDQIIFCSNSFYNMLRNTPELVKTLRQTEYGENVKFTIGEYEGREIIAVPANRFRTGIKLLNGGYGWEAGAKNINFIVCAKSAVFHVTKYDKVRVFNPGVVQDFDGYKVNVRIYHDVFVPENKKPAIYACVSSTAYDAAISSERVLFSAAGTVASKKLTLSSIDMSPRGDLVKGLVLCASDSGVGGSYPVVGEAVPSGAVAVVLGVATSTLSNGTYKLFGVENGMIVTGPAKDKTTPANDYSITIS